ncbi:uncharacterized protein LOC124690835 [Lolium rigidum]|uniref:uncharacterized protein LOC124690835 n=1 Tax=Lolium rigidum TaxID=89674 RepID=UPI001F5CF143|nr:uncharacterized protein LOC124690835 [Lolium rigidum]
MTMTMAPREGDGAAEGGVDLWAMAAELERQFAGYKQRYPERTSSCDIVDDAGSPLQAADGGGASSGDEEEDGDGGGGVRGRMYEAYTRRRDERLRSVWRARMERKEAEVMALWAQLRGGGPAAALAAEDDDDVDGCTGAGEVGNSEAEEDGEKRRSSDVAAPGRVSGKKHARTRKSFSSVNLVKSSRPDVGLRRALSQEPLPPASSVAEGASKKHGAPIGAAATKRKALSGSKGGSVKGHGSVRQAGPKPPRGGLHRRCSSGGMEAVVLPACSSEHAAASHHEDEAQKASSPTRFVGSDNGDTGIETARASSPESEVVDNGAAADGREAELKNALVDVADKRNAEETVVQSLDADAKLGNGEITSDSEIEPSYVVIKKKVVEGKAARGSDILGAGSDADPQTEDKNVGNAAADQATSAADAATATTANADESYDDLSSFTGTGRSDRGSARNSSPSCSSRAQSVERLLEADAALVRKKREDPGVGGRRSAQTVSTPPSARSRGTTTSPRGTGLGFKKRFLSFGKKTRGKDGATVIECTSPASVPASPADCGSARRRCRTADDSIGPRVVGYSSDAAASDDTDLAASPRVCSLQSLVAASPAKSDLSEMVPMEKSPKSHRSFFSFRSFNCGRG